MVAPGGIRTWARRGRKLLLGILLAVVLIVAGVAISFLLAPTRGLWLQAGLRLAAGSLPGELQGQWAWPRLGRIEGHDLVWTVPHESGTGADTLAVIGSVSLKWIWTPCGITGCRSRTWGWPPGWWTSPSSWP